MLFTLQFLRNIFPSHRGTLEDTTEINHVMTDSRIEQSGSLFVPITGERFDAHDFVQQAIDNGAIAAIWHETTPIPETVPDTFTFFLVKDTLEAMQLLAKLYREDVDPIVVGITGSNGKTTTKDLVKAVVSNSYKTHATKGNFNNDIGLPITMLSMPRDTEVLILEMGMNHFHEIERLTTIAQPNFAIITNIGESHIEYLGSREGIAQAKLEIKLGLQSEGQLIIDGDEALLDKVKAEDNVITCGFAESNDVIISDITMENQQTLFQLDEERFHVPLLGKHHAKNASFAITIARKLGISIGNIQVGLEQLAYTQMRFEWLTGKNGVTLINDAYNASLTSMKAAIDVMKQLDGFSRKIVVLGDILELGDYATAMHQSVAESIEAPIDTVYTWGHFAKDISETVKKAHPTMDSRHFEEKSLLIEALQADVKKDTIILFKASRGMHFEELVNACL